MTRRTTQCRSAFLTDVWKALQSQLDVTERNFFGHPLSQVIEMRQAFDAKRADGVLRCSPKLTINDTVQVIFHQYCSCSCQVLCLGDQTFNKNIRHVLVDGTQRSGVLSRISALNSLHTLSCNGMDVLVSCRLTTTPPMPSSHRKNSWSRGSFFSSWTL